MRDRVSPPELPKNPVIRQKRKFPEVKLQKVLDLIKHYCGPVDVEYFGSAKDEKDADILIFLPTATREFKNMVYWGEVHPINKDEQIYQGMGHILMDGNKRIIVVSHFLYIYAARRTSVEAGILGDKADSMMTRIEYERELYVKYEMSCNRKKDGTFYDPIVEIAGPSEAVIYGHTHPNLGCFFSPPDRRSGFATPDLPAVTFVADPIRKEMKAGVGMELKDAEIMVFSYESDLKSVRTDQRGYVTKKTFGADTREISEVRDVSSTQPVKADELISEISRDCSKLMSPTYGSKGKFTSRTTVTGTQKIKMEMTLKPEKKVVKKSATDAGVVGKTYDSYA